MARIIPKLVRNTSSWLNLEALSKVHSFNRKFTTISVQNQCRLVGIDFSQAIPPPILKNYLWLGIFGLFGLKDEEMHGEKYIIHTIKLAKLAQQKGDLKKSEQLLHVALRTAQDLQHSKAEKYIIDEMANVAYDGGDYHKAEKLFIDTIKRLTASGIPQDHISIIQISGKLACLYALVHEDSKASEGFHFCLQQLENKINNGANDFDTLALHSLVLGWFGEFLYSRGHFQDSLNVFEKSHASSIRINGPHHEQSLLQLNNMAAAYASLDNLEKAKTCLKEVIILADQNIEETKDELPCYCLNLANLYLREFTDGTDNNIEILCKAEEMCQKALKLAQQVGAKETIFEAETSLEKIKKYRNEVKS